VITLGWGEFFALAAAFCWALAIVLFRRVGDALPPFELNLFKNLLGFSLILPTLAIVEGMQLNEFTGSEIGISLLSGFIGIAVADTWYLRALNMMGASRTGVVAGLLSPFVIVLSFLFLNESLRGLQLVGFALVMAGILLVTWRQNRREVDTEHLRKGVFFGVGAVFLMAVGIVMVKEILETRPFIWTASIRLTGGVAGMLAYMLIRGRSRQVLTLFARPLPWAPIILASFLSTYLSMMLWLAGYKFIPASVASVLNESANAWIVFLAWLILGEHVGRQKLGGILLTSAGVAIMLLV
jgi:drug/metabolite transporter (DMT)-like permease